MEVSSKKILLGLPIYDISMEDLLTNIDNRITENRKTIIYGLCVGSLSRIKNKKKNLPALLDQMDLVVADGAAIPLIGRFFNVHIREVIPITEFSIEVLSIANDRCLKVMLFGATTENNNLAVSNLKKRFPGVDFPIGINGYYDRNKEMEVVEKINEARPDILLIGMTYPLKEEFSVKYKDILFPSIIIPCGGAIDVFAGKTKRPPKIVKKLMLTWLYRWFQEPGRLKIGNDLRFLIITFPLLILKHNLGIERNPSIIKHYKLKQ